MTSPALMIASGAALTSGRRSAQATRSITNQTWCSGSAIRRPGAISRPPMIPAICVTGWPRITSSRRSRAATAPSYRTSPAQKVDVLHKKLSLNGALCAKPLTTRNRFTPNFRGWGPDENLKPKSPPYRGAHIDVRWQDKNEVGLARAAASCRAPARRLHPALRSRCAPCSRSSLYDRAARWILPRHRQFLQKSLNRSGAISVYRTVCWMFLCPR